MRALAAALLALLALAAPALASFLAAPVPISTAQDGLTVYPTWPVLTAELQDMASRYPDVMRLHSAGKSAKGLDLWLVEVADFEAPGGRPLEGREVLWVDGGTHANEYSGVMFVMHLLRFLVQGYGQDDTATWILENRHTFIMPLLNAEGSLNGIGRLNDNLVNINRNYPVGWGDLAEAPIVNNPGPYPASEMETQHVTAWWQQVKPDYVASIHCCGNLWLYPYGIEGRDPHPDDAPVLSRVCDEAYASVREDCGPIWSTIYPASGSSVDTAYELVGASAWGFEMSGREALLLWGQPFTTSPIDTTESESWAGILHAFANVERYGAHPAVRVEGVEAGAVRLRILNDGWGNMTRGEVRLTDATGAIRAATLPRLMPGEEATLRFEGTFGTGSFPLMVQYGKRPLSGDGLLEQSLSIQGAGGSLLGSLDAAQPLALAALRAPNATPFPAALFAVAVLAGAALLRRRSEP